LESVLRVDQELLPVLEAIRQSLQARLVGTHAVRARRASMHRKHGRSATPDPPRTTPWAHCGKPSPGARCSDPHTVDAL